MTASTEPSTAVTWPSSIIVVQVGSVYTAPLQRCVGVTGLGEVLCYRPAAQSTRSSLPALFRKVAAALEPGGLFAFDLVVSATKPALDYRRWMADETWAVLIDSAEDRRRRRIVHKITTFVKRNRTYHRSHERHELNVFPRARVESWLRAAGFSIRASRRYGAFELPTRRMAFYARKR